MTTPHAETNTTTHFMRELRALHMIADLVAAPNTAAGRDTVVWCVGCSTGDEPYGLAMLCREAGASVNILATDVNLDALATAQRGRYPMRNLRHVDEMRRERWFRRDGSHYTIVPDVRTNVKFREHDILREAAPRHDVDVVICRNVMVHFTPEDTRRALSTMAASLRPGALLVLGAAEWLHQDLRVRDSVQLVPLELAGSIVYQRVDRATPRKFPAGSVTNIVAANAIPKTAPATLPTAASEVEALRREGDELLDRGNAEQARRFYERALERAPLLGDLHLRIALAHLHANEQEAARACLRRALFLTPHLWTAWMMMADLAHDPTYARHCLERARAALDASGQRWNANG